MCVCVRTGPEVPELRLRVLLPEASHLQALALNSKSGASPTLPAFGGRRGAAETEASCHRRLAETGRDAWEQRQRHDAERFFVRSSVGPGSQQPPHSHRISLASLVQQDAGAFLLLWGELGLRQWNRQWPEPPRATFCPQKTEPTRRGG